MLALDKGGHPKIIVTLQQGLKKKHGISENSRRLYRLRLVHTTSSLNRNMLASHVARGEYPCQSMSIQNLLD